MTVAGVALSAGARAMIEHHAAETYPHECCGGLYGEFADGVFTVVEAVAFPNTTSEGPRRRFLIQPSDYRAAEAHARVTKRGLIGFYHSHPDHPAQPSQYDLDHAWPSFAYVIVSVMAGEDKLLTSWRLQDDRSAFAEEAVEITNNK